MAGITVSDIMNANQLWTTSATSWADFLIGIQNNASYLDTNVSHPLSAAWHGTAAELASGQVSTVKGGLIDTAGKLSTIQGLVDDFNGQLSTWQQQLQSIFDQARSLDYDVSPDGTISLTAGQETAVAHDPAAASMVSQVSNLNQQVSGVLAKANQYDGETAAVLRNQMPAKGVALQNPTQWESKYSSLSQIALAYYGNANMWPLIYEANKSTIKNPDLITTSMKLVIPAAAGRPETTASLSPAEAALLAQASGSTTPGTPAVHLTPQEEREIAIANGVSPSQAGPGTTTGATSPGVTYEGNPNDDSYRSSQGGASLPSTTSGDPIAPNSQGLYLPPNATQAESNAS